MDGEAGTAPAMRSGTRCAVVRAMTIRKIAVNTGGGDAPGLNAVIRAVTLSATQRGWEVWGIRHGYRGLLEGDGEGLVRLDREAVRGITHLGGSILGAASRDDPFRYPVLRDGQREHADLSALLVERFIARGFDALVALGGDGSLRLAAELLARGLPRVVAVPKTIDNDLAGTDVTFGFETAITTATDAIDKLHTTAQAHERVMVVEVMGRDAGWIALYSGLAGGADVILLPEIPFELDRVAEKIAQRERAGRTFSIVVVAEGAHPAGGEALFKSVHRGQERGQSLGGIAELVAREIAEKTGKETRSLVLGHLQRGGSPVTADRVLALQLGCAATRMLAEADGSGMVAMRGGAPRFVPLDEATRGLRQVPLDSNVVQSARDLGLCFGDEHAGAFAG